MKNTIILLFLICGILQAGEVDNYLAWEHEIEDEHLLFSEFLNNKVQIGLDKINKKNQFSANECFAVAENIMITLGTNHLKLPAMNAKFEIWAQNTTKVDSYPVYTTTNSEMIKLSLYGPYPSIVERFFLSVDRVVNIGGIYFGTDKLSHFTGSGYIFYKEYLKALKNNSTTLDAIKAAIRKGYFMEGGIIGIKSTGVFSYADLEANFQGMMMAIDMCNGNSPFLYNDNGTWIFKTKIDFRNYVNPYWDESYNVSAYLPRRVKKMKQMIRRNNYCNLIDSAWVLDQNKFYQNYIEEQLVDLRGRIRIINYTPTLIKSLESSEPAIIKIFKKNKMLSQGNYTLKKMCE